MMVRPVAARGSWPAWPKTHPMLIGACERFAQETPAEHGLKHSLFDCGLLFLEQSDSQV